MEHSKYVQKRIALYTVIGVAVFLLCDFSYYLNLFDTDKIWIRHTPNGDFSLRDTILGVDNFLLLFFLFWGVKKATPSIMWFQYFCVFWMEILGVSVFYTIISTPDMDSWNRWLWLGSNVVVFILTLIFKKHPITFLTKMK